MSSPDDRPEPGQSPTPSARAPQAPDPEPSDNPAPAPTSDSGTEPNTDSGNPAPSGAQEAVGAYRALAASAPEPHTENLAGSLANLAIHLRGAGRGEESLEAVRESAGLFMDLAVADPGAHTAHATRGLGLLATYLHDAGRHEEAPAAFTARLEELPPSSRARILLARQEWRINGAASAGGSAGRADADDLLAALREADRIEEPGELGPVRREINQHVQNHAASGAYGALPAAARLGDGGDQQ